MKNIVIVGGGAAGMAAAITAAKAVGGAAQIIIAERLERVGKKLLATGNGRCNLSNACIAPQFYLSKEQKNLEEFLAQMPAETVTDFFADLGLLCTEREQGRIYPKCNQAAMVLDLLLFSLRRNNIQVCSDFAVEKISRRRDGFLLTAEDGRALKADRLLLAAGGKASSALGADGSGFFLAQSLGHSITPLYPALVPIKTANNYFKALKGIRAEVCLHLICEGRELAAESGEVLFTDYGLSGIPALQLSCYLQKGRYQLSLDFFPEISKAALTDMLNQRMAEWGAEPLENFLLGTLAKKIGYMVMKSQDIAPLSRPVGSLSEQVLARLAGALKDWRTPVGGTLGFEQAQVTAGGVPLSEVNAHTMQSECCPDLYLCGELLDAVGFCGGYNLHWAFATGILAGQAIGKL